MNASATKTEQTEAIERLREWLQPGDTVYTILRHVSRSGMQRRISAVKIGEADRIYALDWNVAKALDRRIKGSEEGVVCHGAGMDMGFDLVYSLSRVLFDDGYALNHRWL